MCPGLETTGWIMLSAVKSFCVTILRIFWQTLCLFISPWINLILLEISVNGIQTKAPVIALAVCSVSVLEVCSDVAGPPFIASSLLVDQDRYAVSMKWEEHTSPPIPLLTLPDSVLAPCESPVLHISWPFCDHSTSFLWIYFLPLWVKVHFRSLCP